MTAALAVVAGVALVAIVALLLSRRAASAAVASERLRAQELTSQLEAQRRATDQAQQKAAEAELVAANAISHVEASQKEAARVAEAFWELERLRIEREWRDVAGPAAPLPIEWDGTVRAALAIELEIVREVVGTPSSLNGLGSLDGPPAPATAARAARVGGELLRELARAGDELFVDIADGGPGVAITVKSVAGDKDAVDPVLQRLSAAASSAGGRLEWSPATDGVQAQLSFPGE